MNRLKQLRKQKKLTQEELAVVARVSSKTIRRVEGGEYNFGVESAKRLATFFGVSVDYLLGLNTPANTQIPELINKVNQWAISHGLDKSNPKTQWMKVTEEVGEIRDVFLRPSDFENPEWSLKDAIGDSIVTLIVLCLQLGYDVEECLTIAYNDIKDRKGVMIDDNFIKEKTRQPASDSINPLINLACDQHWHSDQRS